MVGFNVRLEPGILIATKRDKNFTCYSTDKFIDGSGNRYSGGIKINSYNEDDVKTYWDDALLFSPESKPDPKAIISKTKINDLNSPNYKQEMIYNGKSGSTLKFIYREISNNTLRAPFTQEVQYDLNESSTIGFKGVRIDVIEATNTKIKYIVISSFPDAL